MKIYRLRKNRYLKLSKRKLVFFKKTLYPPISFSSKVFHNKHDWNGSTRIRHVICQAVVFTKDVYHWLRCLLPIKWTRVMLYYRLQIFFQSIIIVDLNTLYELGRTFKIIHEKRFKPLPKNLAFLNIELKSLW